MGFVIYQHHTNEFTKWYKSKKEWEYWESQIEQSTHINFPKPINFILHNIMEHTAHHCDMRIPMYNLSKAQKSIETNYSEKMVILDWNLKFYLDSISKCKLYDYDNHSWITFKEMKTQ